MGFEVVQGSPQTIWCPMADAITLYVGQLVQHDGTAPLCGVDALDAASGVYNETVYNTPFGVVVGTNRKDPLYNTTYNAEYITSPAVTDPYGGASIDYVGVEGVWAKGDPLPMVKVALITPCTVLRGPIRCGAIGTGCDILTVTTSCQGDGLGMTTNAAQFTPTADNMQTIYCRSGANAGAYRPTTSTSTTAHTWDWAMRSTVGVGDTFVMAPVRHQGKSAVAFDSVSMWIDGDTAPVIGGTDRWGLNVIRLDLSEPNNEYCEFMFLLNHFISDPTFN